MSFKVVKGQP